ncbi:MAG: hypothetical protein WCO56_12555 [Verrucomicrobiota bacterium]
MTNNSNTVEVTNDSEFLTIVEVPTLAPAGLRTATITGLVMENGKKEDGTPTKALKLTGELEDTDKAGSKFQVEKRYNMLENGRGKAQFLKDASAIVGRKLGDSDLVRFNKTALVGQKVLCEIKHNKKGKHWEMTVGDLQAIAKAATQS